MRAAGAKDAALRGGLKAVGFRLDEGPEGLGPLGIFFGGRHGYYYNIGASELIVDGRVPVRSGVAIERVHRRSITLTDGSELPADLIVLATGYQPLMSAARLVIGTAADSCVPIHKLDEGGELGGVCRPCGHPGLWFMMSAAVMSARYNAKFMALQIKAREAGLIPS
jgi:putative flavoprotein involved in K+ transport